MTASASRRIAIAALLCAALGFASHAWPAPTARTPIKDSAAAAQKWQSDSVLTHVSTVAARADGTAASWLFTYYSPKAKRSAIVTARDGGKVEIEPDVRNSSTDALPGEFIDSDRAVALATKAGLKLKVGASVMLGLTSASAKLSKSTVYWVVTAPRAGGFSSVTLDAKDGHVITTHDLK